MEFLPKINLNYSVLKTERVSRNIMKILGYFRNPEYLLRIQLNQDFKILYF